MGFISSLMSKIPTNGPVMDALKGGVKGGNPKGMFGAVQRAAQEAAAKAAAAKAAAQQAAAAKAAAAQKAAQQAAAAKAAAAKAAADRARGATKPTVLPPTQPKPTVLPSHYTPKPMPVIPPKQSIRNIIQTAMSKAPTTAPVKMAKGGSASSRGDGIARKGKTRGKII